MQMEIKIFNSKIVEEVLLLTTYTSAKTADDTKVFERRRVTIHDNRLLQTLIRFASAELTGIMVDILCEIQTTEQLIKITLSPFLTIGDDMQEALYEAFLRFYVEFVIGRWYDIFQIDQSKEGNSHALGSIATLKQLADTLLAGKSEPEESSVVTGKIARRRRSHPF